MDGRTDKAATICSPEFFRGALKGVTPLIPSPLAHERDSISKFKEHKNHDTREPDKYIYTMM